MDDPGYSTLTKVKNLLTFIICYVIVSLIINWLLQYFEVSQKIIYLVKFGLIIYGLIILEYMTIIFSFKVGYRISESFFYLGIIMITLGILTFIFDPLINEGSDLLNLSKWPLLIGGSYLLTCSIFSKNALKT